MTASPAQTARPATRLELIDLAVKYAMVGSRALFDQSSAPVQAAILRHIATIAAKMTFFDAPKFAAVDRREAALKAWQTMRAPGWTPRAKSASPANPDRRAAALKAWETMRARKAERAAA